MALEAIVAHKRELVRRRRAETPEAALAVRAAPTTRSLRAALSAPGPRFIFECKRASPSAGVLRARYDPVALARALAPYADALSILTEERFFGGSLADLLAVRAAVDRPLLRKDILVDPYEVLEARVYGADAVLLMLSVLDDATYEACRLIARRYGMDVLTEVHDRRELARARRLRADLIGVNNRDLRSLRVDRTTLERLAPEVPPGALLVAESGYTRRAEIQHDAPRADAFLIGGGVMQAQDPARAASALVHGTVKICGLTRAEDARLAHALGASYGGLNFVPSSPRRIDPGTAHLLTRTVPLPWVAVVADAAEDEILTLARTLPLAAVQLHGHEDAGRQQRLRASLPETVALWRAVDAEEDPSGADLDPGALELVLLDRRRGGDLGGSGLSVDPARVALWRARFPRFGLAGGLDPESAPAACRLAPALLDVGSRVENRPGVKDPARLEALFTALRHAPGKRTSAP